MLNTDGTTHHSKRVKSALGIGLFDIKVAHHFAILVAIDLPIARTVEQLEHELLVCRLPVARGRFAIAEGLPHEVPFFLNRLLFWRDFENSANLRDSFITVHIVSHKTFPDFLHGHFGGFVVFAVVSTFVFDDLQFGLSINRLINQPTFVNFSKSSHSSVLLRSRSKK